jgi:hypothetical protein
LWVHTIGKQIFLREAVRYSLRAARWWETQLLIFILFLGSGNRKVREENAKRRKGRQCMNCFLSAFAWLCVLGG